MSSGKRWRGRQEAEDGVVRRKLAAPLKRPGDGRFKLELLLLTDDKLRLDKVYFVNTVYIQ